MRHILIPTDFTVQSLNAVHAAVAAFGGEKLKVTLFHLLRQPGSLDGLLFASRRNSMRAKQADMINEEFKETCEILKNTYKSKIESIQVKFGMGDTAAYVRNFLEGSKVNTVVYCTDTELGLPSKDSIPMMKLLQRTKYDTQVLPSAQQRALKHHEEMQELTGNELRLPKDIDYVITK